MYALLRAIARVALRWYYRDIQVEGLDRFPRHRPLLLVVNHPNALVDALLVGGVLPRRILITAKSSLFTNPIGGALLRWLGVVPLRRTNDEAQTGKPLDPSRNLGTFRAVHQALRDGGAVLIFPEGITHDMPSLAPLKTGAARMALHARKAGDVPELAIVPIGLTFERKEAPRSRVLVQVGEPIVVADWAAPVGINPADALTSDIDARLREVTLNYATMDDAARAVRLTSVIAALFNGLPPIGRVDRGLAVETSIARRIDILRARMPLASRQIHARVDALVRRIDALYETTAAHHVLIEDIEVSLAWREGIRFILREGWWLLFGGPVALWGWLNHWLPFRAARAIAMHSIESAADPAMRTVVAGAALVVATYLAQTVVVAIVWGPLVAAVYLVSLPIAADINFYLGDRLRRAAQRARTFLRFRRDRALQLQLVAELRSLRDEALALDRALTEESTAERETFVQ